MSIQTSAIRRMGRILGPQALAPIPISGPKMGRYALKDRLGERTWRAIDTKRGKMVLVQVLGRAPEASEWAAKNLALSAINHPVILPWYKITVCGELTIGARRFVDEKNRREELYSAYQLAQAVESIHEKGEAHGAIDDEHVMFDRAGTPLLLGFRLDAKAANDVRDLRKLISKWVRLRRDSYPGIKPIVEELQQALMESQKNLSPPKPRSPGSPPRQ